MIRYLLVLILIVSPITLEAGKKWTKLENCKFDSARYHDGDSFYVIHKSRRYHVRLYCCDTPETDFEGYEERVIAQSQTYGLDRDQLLKAGEAASKFTAKLLGKGKFTVWTKWANARGRSKRYYVFIVLEDGSDLTCELVKHGMSAMNGLRIGYPDGKTSGSELQHKLSKLQAYAKRKKLGVWATSTLTNRTRRATKAKESDQDEQYQPYSTWKNKEGQSISARLISVRGKIITFQLQGTGKQVDYDLGKLDYDSKLKALILSKKYNLSEPENETNKQVN